MSPGSGQIECRMSHRKGKGPYRHFDKSRKRSKVPESSLHNPMKAQQFAGLLMKVWGTLLDYIWLHSTVSSGVFLHALFIQLLAMM